jgi:hypothetical protein
MDDTFTLTHVFVRHAHCGRYRLKVRVRPNAPRTPELDHHVAEQSPRPEREDSKFKQRLDRLDAAISRRS